MPSGRKAGIDGVCGVDERVAAEGEARRLRAAGGRVGGAAGRDVVRDLAILVVVAHRESELEIVQDVVGQLPEHRVHRAGEAVVVEQVGGVRPAGRHERLRNHALPQVAALRHDDVPIDVGKIDAAEPSQTLVAGRGQSQLDAGVLLIALLVLVAVAGRRAVRRQESGATTAGGREPETGRDAEERRLVSGISEARIVGRRAGARSLECIQAERAAGSVGQEEVLLVVPGDVPGQRREPEIPVALDRQVEVVLLVLRLDVVDVAEVVVVGVFVEGRGVQERRRVGQRNRRIEVDRTRLDLGILGLEVELAAAEIEHQATDDAGLLEGIDTVVAVELQVVPLAVVSGECTQRESRGCFSLNGPPA